MSQRPCREKISSFVLATGLHQVLGQPLESTLPYFWITLKYRQRLASHCYAKVQIWKSGLSRLSFCSMNNQHLNAHIPKRTPN